MKKMAILASGNGTNFEAIMQTVETGELQVDVALVFSDRPTAYVLERAKHYQIACVTFSPKEFPTKADYEAALLGLLNEHNIELVVLAGYLRILGTPIIQAYPNKIINLHPSLLPDYPGLKSIERAYHDRQKVTGVTIHYVDEGLDTGPIIRQASLAIKTDESLSQLEERVHQLEHQLYPAALKQLLNEELKKS